ncbi:hypothetical protein MLD38_007983 [Melastoma candidum]|uniref:Uncharacterized protein n=1 Tax=Melastoma candidum TaxID=119954 RepID=A0ACB9RU78_9MYRT|nr:hypothetical protein MLD38_007983 [Melastoma candidum]
MKGGVLVDEGFRFQEETNLTVCKTSLFFADDGFNVYDAAGDLVFRVDSYGPDSAERARSSSWMLTAAASSPSDASGRACISGGRDSGGSGWARSPSSASGGRPSSAGPG